MSEKCGMFENTVLGKVLRPRRYKVIEKLKKIT
jgi:hypothetical protein